MIAIHLLKAIDLSGECFGLPCTIRNVFQVAFILISKRDVGFHMRNCVTHCLHLKAESGFMSIKYVI